MINIEIIKEKGINKMKSKITIFETGIKDGIMSKNPKFYEKKISEEERIHIFHDRRINLGKKLGIDGNHIFKANQKGQYKTNHKDGDYILLDENYMKKEDYYEEELPTDILIISSDYKKIAVGNPQADCPILICEDRKKGYTALSHCGASFIDRKLPIDTIKALQKCCGSSIEDIYVYISSCIKKESYIYDTYPKWATNKDLWKDFIIEKDNNFYIDLVGAIEKQLKDIGIKHIDISPIDTFKDNNYYSHAASTRGNKEKSGQNFVGFYYN